MDHELSASIQVDAEGNMLLDAYTCECGEWDSFVILRDSQVLCMACGGLQTILTCYVHTENPS